MERKEINGRNYLVGTGSMLNSEFQKLNLLSVEEMKALLQNLPEGWYLTSKQVWDYDFNFMKVTRIHTNGEVSWCGRAVSCNIVAKCNY